MKSAYKAVVILLTLGPMSAASSGGAASGSPEWTVAFVAHRGGIIPGYPENTLAAFRQAIKHGAEVIEIDLRGTKYLEKLIKLGVNGILSDLPEVMNKLLADMKKGDKSNY